MSDRKTTLHIYRPGVPVETQMIDLPEEPGYRRLKEILMPLLDGGDLEHVSVLFGGRRADMFVDDRGIEKDLPRNEAATAIYRANWLSRHPGADPESIPAIYGLAVLFDRIVWR